jgi:hypothetical protein
MAPIEWLRGLDEVQDGYQELLREAGSLSIAAWRLARARAEVWGVSGAPNRRELHAAAGLIAQRTGADRVVPASSHLASECEAEGLLVV